MEEMQVCCYESTVIADICKELPQFFFVAFFAFFAQSA
jgi:hypothetical protein